ncbi:helix-turn-helix domain-containing protein [Nocardioides sp. cx-173]|uniref:helix-turn-helix domain-containing protein n=1 Tax=Nocardioides sp. cx-173 TaxID=2898796 RepID=UPI001E60D848|nr:helix-turn-helix domain-containing protein [Nocardioides sp. cx-173]MCD4525227.1 helix-turn-helix domain-containing protein [Nocardioides sp. cx-173]UGB40970.1 helix-turn-helix domain-containing protein [Nocardioides sp. cx-173]
MDLALRLNCARRHLTREQRRELIRTEIVRRPDDSDRAIARRIGCSPSTVGAVRGEEVSNLDTPTLGREEAEAQTAELEEQLENVRVAVFALIVNALSYGITVPEVVMALTQARMSFEAEHKGPPEAVALFRRAVFDYLTTVVMWPETMESVNESQGVTPIDASPEMRATVLDSLARVFAEPVKAEAR